MKKNEIKVGGLYTAKVSDRIVKVRIDSVNSQGGWNATNTATGKRIRVKSAQRLRSAAKAGKTKGDADCSDTPPTADASTSASTTEQAAKPAEKQKAKKAKKGKKADGEKKPKRPSVLDAAAEVLKSAGQPMRTQEMIAAMAEKNLWKSPGGKTPHATLYAAIIREIRDKGAQSRFNKTERGLFEFNKAEA